MYLANTFEDFIKLNKPMQKPFRKYCKAAYAKGFHEGSEYLEREIQKAYERGFEDAKKKYHIDPLGVTWI